MRLTTKFMFASLLTGSLLLAQGPPAPGFGGHGRMGPGHMGFGHMGFGGPTVTGAPFSATTTETHQETLTDGNQIQQTHTAKLYRDAEGRTRLEATMPTPSGASKTMITIVDPVAGFIAHLNPADASAMKQTLRKPPAGAELAPHTPPADAIGPKMVKADLGTKTIGGLAATGTRTTVTIPAGEMGNSQPIVETREVWVSTALKIPIQVTSSDPRHGTSSMKLSNISQAAPEAALFQIPSGYAVKDAPLHHGHSGPGGVHLGPGAADEPAAPPALDSQR